MDKLFQTFMRQGLTEDAALALSWSLMGRPRGTFYDNTEDSISYHGVQPIAMDALETERAATAKQERAAAEKEAASQRQRTFDKSMETYRRYLRKTLGPGVY